MMEVIDLCKVCAITYHISETIILKVDVPLPGTGLVLEWPIPLATVLYELYVLGKQTDREYE